MIVDLFAGPGGWSTGLTMLGRAETLGIEWDQAACDTARAALHHRLQADVAQLDPLEVTGDDVEGLIASPPCQGFSMAGKGRGREDSELIIAAVGDLASGLDPRETVASKVKDARSVLALEPLRWALDLEPEWMAWEQVPAVLPLWQACAEVLRADGYDVWTGLVQAETLGVPQTRKRAILRARRGVLEPLRLTHSRYYPRSKTKLDPGVAKWVSMAEALGWGTGDVIGFPRRADGEDVVTLDGVDYRARDLRSSDSPAQTVTEKARSWSRWELPQYVNGNQAHSARRSLDEPAPTVHFGARVNVVEWQGLEMGDVRSSHGCVRGVDQPAPTLTASMDNGNFQWRQPDPTRSRNDGIRVTVEEAAVLQSFPPDYPWRGTKTAQYRQVGDAVPPLMAAHILASVGAADVELELAEELSA